MKIEITETRSRTVDVGETDEMRALQEAAGNYSLGKCPMDGVGVNVTFRAEGSVVTPEEEVTRKDFVKMVEGVVTAAMPNMESLELVEREAQEYILATNRNGEQYKIGTEKDYLIVMAYDAIRFLMDK